MSALKLRLPDSLHDQVRVLASQDNVSMNQFIALAVAEKVSALMTVDYLAQRAKRGSREKFDTVLDKVRASDAQPEEMDRLPEGGVVTLA
ncbi:MAG: toxin-antitoxin system HicB family antitoxin [Caldilineaceae bacterium]|nr:toxin-antitoxin system HicB family antitoxin [Caldilineaceae bacterium]MBP8109561.1 toxin-antitoxin system HicB family antitoxin [Caldilineaceae bacterium]MBP8124061.1 toxin-antitoxin system HicB family antitoxin [Caldilineaceae bacterium]MBP9074568.1 toxin-antitoxin system HicB family antitoxin [Caldilineaceae bacterium]